MIKAKRRQTVHLGAGPSGVDSDGDEEDEELSDAEEVYEDVVSTV